jgi:hypothetical protein
MNGMLSMVRLSNTTRAGDISGNSTRLAASVKRGRIARVELSLSPCGFCVFTTVKTTSS